MYALLIVEKMALFHFYEPVSRYVMSQNVFDYFRLKKASYILEVDKPVCINGLASDLKVRFI